MSHVTSDRPKTKSVMLDPKLASKLLEQNDHNRPVVQSRINFLAKEIAEGRWADNGQTIVINGDGTLLDGQHRCLAVLKTGIPIPAILVTGVDKDAQLTMDTGAKRSTVDVLQIAGVKFAHTTATTVANLIRLKYPTLGRERLSTSKIIRVYERNAQRIGQAVAVAHSRNLHTVVPGAALATCVFADLETGQSFTEVFKTGKPYFDAADPAHTLREAVLRETKLRRRPNQRFMFYTTLLAFNYFKASTPMPKVEWKDAGVAIDDFDVRQIKE